MIPVPASRTRYRDALRGDVIPFWERHSPDPVHGGFFTCLDRDGAVYDPTKFLWLQWRAVWMFATLHARVEPRPAWLALAEQGFDFLERHGRDDRGRAYFALNRRGEPAMAPYSLYTESFAALGAAALFRITGNPVHRRVALHARDEYARRLPRPKEEWTKELAGAPALDSLGAHMIRANLLLELEDALGDTGGRGDLALAVETVLDRFWSPEHQALFEHARPGGGFDLDSMVGRRLNPGHALEAAGFILAAAERLGRADWIPRAVEIVTATLARGWDAEQGGLFYFLDVLDRPPEALEWSMKLWWVHCEALVALAWAHRLTGEARFVEDFARLDEWTWAHFPDPGHGEWFGYLDRAGRPTHLLKGGKWKGFFHLPRMLLALGG